MIVARMGNNREREPQNGISLGLCGLTVKGVLPPKQQVVSAKLKLELPINRSGPLAPDRGDNWKLRFECS